MEYFELGTVVNTHGIRGMIKVLPGTDEPSQFEALGSVIIGGAEYAIERVGYVKKTVLLKLAGVDDMSAAEGLRGLSVSIYADKALPLNADEYYIRDLVGLTAVTEDGRRLGAVSEVIRTGANDVYAIEGGLLIPAIKQCILRVDIPAGVMTVRLLDGLEKLGGSGAL